MAELTPPGNELAAWVFAKAATAFSGLAGAYVRNLFPPFKPWKQRAAEYVGGALAAVYAGPVAGPVLGRSLERLMSVFGVTMGDALPRANVESLAGFLCGVIGLTVIEGIFVLARRWRDNPRIGI